MKGGAENCNRKGGEWGERGSYIIIADHFLAGEEIPDNFFVASFFLPLSSAATKSFPARGVGQTGNLLN